MTEFDDLENQDFTEHQPADRRTNSLHPSKDDLADVEPGQQPAAKPADDESDDDESDDDESDDDESDDEDSEDEDSGDEDSDDEDSEEPAEKSEKR